MVKNEVIKMIDWEFLLDLVKRLVEIGSQEREIPSNSLYPFLHY